MAVITISRELGSEGGKIADILRQEMQYQQVDKALIVQIAKEAGMDVDALLAMEQSFTKRARLVSPEMRSLYGNQPTAFDKKAAISDQTYKQIVHRTIEQSATQGNVIIIGRGGQIVLHDWPDAFHVHLHAPPELRAHRLMARFNILEPEAKRRIAESDEEKKRYIAHVFQNADWKDLRYYHLVINTALIPPEKAAQLIIRAITPTVG